MAKLEKWGVLNEHEELKHKNALDLNFRPVRSKKLHYRLPDWMDSNIILNLSACGNSQLRILLASVQLLSMKLEKERKQSYDCANSEILNDRYKQFIEEQELGQEWEDFMDVFQQHI